MTCKGNKHFIQRLTSILLIAIMLASLVPLMGKDASVYAANPVASGKIAENGTNLRKSASASSKRIKSLKKGTKLTITGEVFTNAPKTSSANRWYHVKAGKSSGYVRADLVTGIKFKKKKALTTDSLNYRNGPSTKFKKLGLLKNGAKIKLVLPARVRGSSETWYRASVGGKTAYVHGSYVVEEAAIKVNLKGKSALAKKLLTNPTNGGKARYVYTFDKNNCKKRFLIEGYGKAHVPQGLAYSGSRYYAIFGMSDAQSVVTYNSKGKRISASKFGYKMGHPNGITYNPKTKLCYIFRGYTYTVYTWDPVTNKFGKTKSPYSSSGIAYDRSTDRMYASSKTGIREYSNDGKFTHYKLFSRASHKFKHYVQDCGAGGGFIFHGISGSNKHKSNYLDVYRAADSKYLGTINVKLGEIESVIVTDKGDVELLINHKGTYKEYVWRTPLNVNDLK